MLAVSGVQRALESERNWHRTDSSAAFRYSKLAHRARDIHAAANQSAIAPSRPPLLSSPGFSIPFHRVAAPRIFRLVLDTSRTHENAHRQPGSNFRSYIKSYPLSKVAIPTSPQFFHSATLRDRRSHAPPPRRLTRRQKNRALFFRDASLGHRIVTPSPLAGTRSKHPDADVSPRTVEIYLDKGSS